VRNFLTLSYVLFSRKYQCFSFFVNSTRDQETTILRFWMCTLHPQVEGWFWGGVFVNWDI
jgi:hypothetical protein